MSTRQLLTMASVAAIINKRTPIAESNVGRSTVLTIQGRGNVLDVLNKEGEFVVSASTGEILQKKIFNCKAVSRLALKNERNVKLMQDGIAYEKAGDAAKADECYVEFLNKVQLSFGVLLPSAVADKLDNGVEISAKIQRVDTEKGSLLTLDSSTIAIKEPDVITDSVNFNLDAFMPKTEEKATGAKPMATT